MSAPSDRGNGTAAASAPAMLEVHNLSIAYGALGRQVTVVSDVSFSVGAGEALGVVGESGCGKSQTMLGVLRLLPPGGAIGPGGRVLLHGRDLLHLSARQMREVRGSAMALISQDALTALNPVMTVGAQMAEPLVHYEGMSRTAAAARCVELLDLVGIPGARARLASYPHELSGGMRQRVLIAMAISREPQLLIADEPTTALDVTIQSQILRLLDRLRRDLGMALVLISHDLGVVAGVADKVAIMYAGRVVETATTEAVFDRPQHPYTQALLQAIPRLDTPVQDDLLPIPGLPPDPRHPIAGCPFHPRCGDVQPRCADALPALTGLGRRRDHLAACWVAATRAGVGEARGRS